MRKGKMEDIPWVKEIAHYKKISRTEAKRRSIEIVPIRWSVTDKGTQTGQIQTCWKRAVSEDEGNPARARTLQCDGSVGELQSIFWTSC